MAEWARRHTRPFTLHLTGTAGGVFVADGGGPSTDGVQFARTPSGREPGEDLLATRVPF